MGCCAKGGISGPMQCAWREGGCELNPLCNMWLLGTWRCSGVRGSLARVALRFVCKMCRGRGRKAADEFWFKDVKLDCVGEFVYLGDMLNDIGGVEQINVGSSGQINVGHTL